MFNDNICRIVVEGPIGVGKTTLARKLAERLDFRADLEQPENNPFLEKFYRAMDCHALSTQLYFLFQRSEQLEQRNAGLAGQRVVADYMLEKDRLFAELTLTPEEFELYDKVYRKLDPDLSPPDLVVYLQAPMHDLVDRVRHRRADWDYHLESDYLEKVDQAYATFFHNYRAAPLLIVNTGSVNTVENPQDFDMLLDYMGQIETGRHYFNPLGSQ
ncbi:MAG: deoxynucleoside kinase [Gammaproteobacteria bacterium]|nr:MAG: deoxynucleoside kinase [Gammaproteobacteria bacterium]